MELRQLSCFAAVAEEGGFAAAATRLGLAQSTVSWTVRRLEEELATELFERGRHGTTLTATGRALLPEARRALTAVDAAWEAIEEAKAGVQSTLRVAAAPVLEILDLPAVLESFVARHPEVRLQVRQANDATSEILGLVASGALDLAIVSVVDPPPDTIDATTLAAGPLGVAVAADDPLAANAEASVALESVADRTFVDIPEGFSTRIVADHVFAAAGRTRRTGYEVDNVRTALDYVRNGYAVALMAQAAIPAGDERLRFLVLRGESPLLRLVVATGLRPRTDAPIGELRDALVAAVADRQ